ncbi:MAG: hypothetical protein JSV04_01020 [Candidatus Heimdallarchaeota archaeon]|nr:MAG: hypothetical protein JSV04_01020 [Candidatus Heimdallarchaeota archaeon]
MILHATVRPQQQRSFEIIQQNWHQYHSFFCSLPTGSGKTDLAACLLADYLYTNTVDKIDILVPYRMHQDFWYNILRDYGIKHNFSVALLKGRSSYYCPIIKSGANISPCAFDPLYAQTCRSRSRCPLLKARRRIRKSQVRILNWWVFKYVDLGEEKANFRIFDEAHNLLNLESLLRVEISYSFLKNVSRESELPEQFLAWEQSYLTENQNVTLELEEGLEFIKKLQLILTQREQSIAKILKENPQSIQLETLRELKRITDMITALAELISNPIKSDLTLFFQRDNLKKQTQLILQPFDIGYIFSKLFRGSKNLFLSATIGDGEYLAQLLGLHPPHCHFIHEISSFAKENHPFLLLKEAERISTATKKKKESAFRVIEDQTQIFLELLKQHQLRGIILTPSFELANLMGQLARTSKLQVITHTAGKSDAAIRAFIVNREGDVLITPSAWEGISLDDDLARLCLIPKLPFPMLKDPIIQKKVKKYPDFLENSVLIAIQQAHGRIQRNASDWGVSICFDGNFRWLIKKNAKALEPWFSNRLQEISGLEAEKLIVKLITLLKSNNRPESLKKERIPAFARMKNGDRKWLESTGLADLLKK